MTIFAVTTPTFATKAVVPSTTISQDFADVGTLVTNTQKQWRTLEMAVSVRTTIASTANFAVFGGGAGQLISNAAASSAIVYLEPADLTMSPGTVQWRTDFWYQTETAPTASTLTCALYPIASTAAGVITLGSVVAGSSTTTASFSTANVRAFTSGTAFTAPAAGFYVVVFTHSVNPAQTLTYGWSIKGSVV